MRNEAGVSPKPIEETSYRLSDTPEEENTELHLEIKRSSLFKSFETAMDIQETTSSADILREKFRKIKADAREYLECDCYKSEDWFFFIVKFIILIFKCDKNLVLLFLLKCMKRKIIIIKDTFKI